MTNQNQTEQLPETPGRNAASCTRLPAGWLCSRGLNHDGPCAPKRASCEIPNASGRWSCDDEWGHTGDLHGSAGDGYYSQQHIVAHHARQATRRAYEGEQALRELHHNEAQPETELEENTRVAAEWANTDSDGWVSDDVQAPRASTSLPLSLPRGVVPKGESVPQNTNDRRLDQAQLREQAQQTGGGVDERRQRGEPTTAQVRTALPPKEFAPIPSCRECGLKVTHKRGCTLAFGYVAPAPYEPGETMKNVRVALAPAYCAPVVRSAAANGPWLKTSDPEAEIGSALQERVVDLQGRLALAKWATVLFMCTTVAATAWAVWLGGWPW